MNFQIHPNAAGQYLDINNMSEQRLAEITVFMRAGGSPEGVAKRFMLDPEKLKACWNQQQARGLK